MHGEWLFSLVARQRRRLIWLLAAAACVWFGYAAQELFRAERANRNIRDLAARHDVKIDVRHAHPQEVLARINESMRRDNLDEAQAMLSASETALPPEVRAAILYNIANARTLLAAESVRKGDYDTTMALINLAKSEYRLSLKLDPSSWDARYNIDVAMRVVRDLPQGDNPDTTTPDAPKKLWTDLPGVPKGLP